MSNFFLKTSFRPHKCSRKKTLRIVEKLEKYWANELPGLDNKKTWFFKISKEFKVKIDTIVEIELKYRPRNFKPSKTLVK